MAPATKTKKVKPVEEEIEELDDEVELESLDEELTAPKAKTKRADSPEFGINELCAYLERKTGKAYSPREVRVLIRKMARDGSNRIDREIVPGNRARYSWSGTKDPQVQTILSAAQGGEIEAGKKESLDRLKETVSAKRAAEPKPAKTKTKTKVVEPDDDDDDLEELDED